MLVANFIQALGRELPVFFLVEARVAALFTSLFFLRKDYIPSRILLALSVVLSVFVMMTGQVRFEGLPADSFFLAALPELLTQIALGLVMGLVINLFAEIFLSLGQIVSMQAGLGFVNFYVPKIGSITPLTQFFVMSAIIIFFELNGHLVLMNLVINSFRVTTHQAGSVDVNVFKQVLVFAKIIFSGAFMLSLSITIAILLSNLTLAIMTKFSPQVNIFSIGINISLIVCYFATYLTYDVIVGQGRTLFNEVLAFLKQVGV
jgi:flagellar biosynthetic protein FliR